MSSRLCAALVFCLLLAPAPVLAEPDAARGARFDDLRLASVPLPGTSDEAVVHPGQALEVFLSPSDFPDAVLRLVQDGDDAVFTVNLDETALRGEAVPARVRWPRIDGRSLVVTAPAETLPLEPQAEGARPTPEELTDQGTVLEWYLRPLEGESDTAELRAEVRAVRIATPAGRTLISWSEPEPAPPCGEPSLGQPRCRVPGTSRVSTSIAVHPSGRWVAVAGGDLRPRIDLWRGSPPRLVRRLTFPPWSGLPAGVQFTADGQTLVVADAAGTLHCLEAETGGGHRLVGRQARAFVLIEDGATIAAADAEGGLTIWRMRDGTIEARIGRLAHGTAPLLAASADGRRIAALSTEDGQASLIVWEPEQERAAGQVAGVEAGFIDLALDAEGEHVLATHDRLGLLRYRVGGEARLAPWGGSDGLRCRGRLALSFDRSLLACATPDPGVAVFDAIEGRLVRTLTTGSDESVGALAFTPDGARLLATAGGELLEWSLAAPAGGSPR
jgi:hypothetical protein